MKKAFVGASRDGEYRLVVHFTTPAGINDAGVTWKSCVLGLGRNTTSLSVGTAATQITQAEEDAIVAGDVVEVVGSIRLDSAGNTNDERIAYINVKADQLRGKAIDSLSALLTFCGHTQDVP